MNSALIFGKTFEEIQAMQDGRGQKKSLSSAFKLGDSLKFSNVNLWHPRHAMTVTCTHPLRVRFANGKEGEVWDKEVLHA